MDDPHNLADYFNELIDYTEELAEIAAEVWVSFTHFKLGTIVLLIGSAGDQGVALAREKLAGSIDGVGNIFSEKF